MYYVFDGIDGCGKTTVVSEISRLLRLSNFTPICLHEPTFGEFGRAARELITVEEKPSCHQLHALFTQDREEHVRLKIKPALKFVLQNPTFKILQDRGYLSAPAYQACDDESIWKLLEEQMAISPLPDRFFLIDVDIAIAMERIKERGDGRSIFDRAETLEIARERYLLIAESGKVPIDVIDGSMPVANIVDKIVGAIGLGV